MSVCVSLPEDVILEILLRLPVKSLQRFKCVSKSWCALISDHSFIMKHFINSKDHEMILMNHIHPTKGQLLSLLSSRTNELKTEHFQISYPGQSFHSSYRDTPGLVRVLGHFNGVLCLFDGKHGVIFLWNPANRQLKTLPKSRVKPPTNAYPINVCVGFGFDDQTNDYKVLAYMHMCFPPSSIIAHAELYTLSTNKWKEVQVGEEFQPKGKLLYSYSSITIDGIFSWFEKFNNGDKLIFSFNMKNEVFMKTQPPDYNDIPLEGGILTCLRNKLAFIHSFGGDIIKYFDVWVLEEYGVRESWVKQLTIGPFSGVTSSLGFWKDGELLLNDDRQRLVSYYRISDYEYGEYTIFQDQGMFQNILQVFPYKESLVCLNEDEKDKSSDQNMEGKVITTTEYEEESTS